MKFNFFDIHSHLNLSPLLERADEIVAVMAERGVGTIVVGVDLATSKQAIELAEKYDNVWACIGMHPNDNIEEAFDMESYRALAEHERVVAIGECGLDYFRGKDEALVVRQKELFLQQIKLALEVGKPLMIHGRPSKGTQDAYEDVLDILAEYPDIRANFHFFVGDMTIAKRALAAGFTMSFDGPITFSRDYDEVIQMLPLEHIMLETDAPFAAPEPYRGQTPSTGQRPISEPWMVEEMYKKIAELKNIPLQEVKTQLLRNVERVFAIPCAQEM